jgi:acetolactate synthase-1/2/3 large subunit
MKLSDVVAAFLAENSIKHVFAISGGASLHLIHSIAETPGTSFVCPQHEQAGAMAADAYARVTGGLGCAVATSGPGATNLVTGICSSYYDSVPVLYLTGQVATFRSKGDTGVRQIGFQETDMVSICKTITKYAVLVTAAEGGRDRALRAPGPGPGRHSR